MKNDINSISSEQENGGSKSNSNSIVIGVAGGSGSGKTTVVNHMVDRIGNDNIALLEHDAYYRNLEHLPFEERAQQNFDHPSALETELLIQHIKALLNGFQVQKPVYDFSNHLRKDETLPMQPNEVILVDGILIYTEKELRNLIDIKVFVDTDDDVRLLRRIRRDTQERSRSLSNVLRQYEEHVRPMHLEFVEPTKRYADIIIPRGGENSVALDMLDALISRKIEPVS